MGKVKIHSDQKKPPLQIKENSTKRSQKVNEKSKETIDALSKQVIFLGDFNSKHKQFGCVKPNKSDQMLVNIAKYLKLFYVNQLGPKRHTRDDPVHGTSDILDMAFISPGLSSRDICFNVADDHVGSDHFSIQISFDKPLKQNTPLTEPRY